MTISTTASKVVCLGNGSTSVFSYNFLIPLASDVVVIFTDVNGNSQTLSTSQYTITGINNPTGGTVTYPTSGSPIGFGTTLTIQRVVPLVQNTSISNQGAFYPEVVETGLDTVTMLIQQLNTAIINSLQVPVTDSSAPTTLPGATQRAGQMLGFDSSGNPIAAQPGSALISTVMQPFVSAVSLAAAANLLGLPVFVGVGATTGTANAQVLAGTIPGTFALTAGNKVVFVPGFTNLGAMTLQIGALPATNVFKRGAAGPVALAGGELFAAQMTTAVYDGTQFVLEDTVTGPATSTAGHLASFSDGTGKNLQDAITVGIGGKASMPSFDQYRANTATGQVANLTFTGQNASAAAKIFGGIETWSDVATAGAEYGHVTVKSLINGTYANRFYFGAGMYSPGATGGDVGADSINTVGYYVNGVRVPFQNSFSSAQQTITSGGALTLAHGLGVQPKLYQAYIVCQTAEFGYSIGDEVIIDPSMQGEGTLNRGIAIVPDATNLNIRMGSSNPAFVILNKSTGGSQSPTNANWKLVVRAWA